MQLFNPESGKLLFYHAVDALNNTTSETDLYSDNLIAGQLAKDGDSIIAMYGGGFTGSATSTRRVRVYFGGSVLIDTNALSITLASEWRVSVLIVRKNSGAIRASAVFTTEVGSQVNVVATVEVGALTLTSSQILKITGQAAGAGAETGDIFASVSTVQYVKGP